VISYSLFTLLPFSSLLLFAAVWGRDAAARCNEVPLVFLLHNLNIPPSFKDLGVHTISVPTYSHCQAVYSVLLTSRSVSPPWTSALHPVT
jgi:hypothetical protein